MDFIILENVIGIVSFVISVVLSICLIEFDKKEDIATRIFKKVFFLFSLLAFWVVTSMVLIWVSSKIFNIDLNTFL